MTTPTPNLHTSLHLLAEDIAARLYDLDDDGLVEAIVEIAHHLDHICRLADRPPVRAVLETADISDPASRRLQALIAGAPPPIDPPADLPADLLDGYRARLDAAGFARSPAAYAIVACLLRHPDGATVRQIEQRSGFTTARNLMVPLRHAGLVEIIAGGRPRHPAVYRLVTPPILETDPP